MYSSFAMQRRKFVQIAAATGVTIGLAGCADDEPTDEDTGEGEAEIEEEPEGDETDEEETEDEEAEDEEAPSLELVEHELVEEEFSVEVQGLVRNNGDEETFASVEVVFYDEDGTRIDTGRTNTSDLAPDEEWAFDVLTTEDAEDIAEYDIELSDSAL